VSSTGTVTAEEHPFVEPDELKQMLEGNRSQLQRPNAR